MSDDIGCCVEGCLIDAEIEVVRSGQTLWICGDHYKLFIKRLTTFNYEVAVQELREAAKEALANMRYAVPTNYIQPNPVDKAINRLKAALAKLEEQP